MPRFFLNSSPGLYRHPYGSGDLALVLRRCTNRKPLTFGFPWYPPPQATPPSLPADLAQVGRTYHIANWIERIYLSA
jgi:hypothetical protein